MERWELTLCNLQRANLSKESERESVCGGKVSQPGDDKKPCPFNERLEFVSCFQ